MDNSASNSNKYATINTYYSNYLDDEFSDLKAFELINELKNHYDQILYPSKIDQQSFSFLKFEDRDTERNLSDEETKPNNSLLKKQEEEKKPSYINLNLETNKPILGNQSFLSDKSNTLKDANENSTSLFNNTNKSLFDTNIINNSVSGSNLFPKTFQTSNINLAQNISENKPIIQIRETNNTNFINAQQVNQNIQEPKKTEILKERQEKELLEPPLKAETFKHIESENKPKLSAMQKLRIASDNYFNLRSKINQISEDKNKKIISDKIATEVNVIINQLSQMDDINKDASRISNLLGELKKSNQLELYLFTVDMLIKRLIFKSEKYKNEHKRNYLIFGKFIFELNKLVGSNLICDFFMQMIVYKCPYIALKEINKADYPDDKTYKKRLGFTNESESMTDFFSNIESYTYLFFAFLFHSLRFYSSNPNHPNYKHYLSNILLYLEDFIHFFENCESKEIKYPHVVIYKVFLNCLGNEMLKHVSNVTEKLIKIAMKIVKHMEEQKKKPGVTSEIKSLITDNLHFIKTYAKEIKERKITDMHK